VDSEHAVVVAVPAVRIAVDAPKVERIVENLVVNAARHTPAGTTIWVRVEPRRDGALLVVEDEGPGVPAQLREQVFQPFRKGRNVADHAPGSGWRWWPASRSCTAAAPGSRTALVAARRFGCSSPTSRSQTSRTPSAAAWHRR
jgi:hypothetical protein